MPILILPLNLSSQISSGEIIERPASVIKEIIENSIDADSKNIDISIEKSGFQSIFLKDDGCGITKKDLPLAIAHHATSKIRSLSDLDEITTFGFRGEGLASIKAVSRLTLISCTEFDGIAWKIYSEELINNHNNLQPIAHPRGTTVIIENLFYNIPIRLKFLKNKKLEFLKIVEVIKKIALSHFNINFSFKHNKKLIIKYNSINNENDKINRLKDVFKKIDTNKLIEIKKNKNDLFLFGWILHYQDFKELKNIQYCYVNNRFIYNNIFINAVRNAYYEIIGNKNVSFILYLKVSPSNIDINIHPTKNEIKFHKPIIIYEFIYATILYSLMKFKKCLFNNLLLGSKVKISKKSKPCKLQTFNSNIIRSKSFYLFKNKILFNNRSTIKKDHESFFFDSCLKKYNSSLGKLLIVVRKYYGLIYNSDNFFLISFPLAQGIVRKEKLKNAIIKKIKPKSFLTNIKINVTTEEYKILFNNKEILIKFGFHLIFEKNYITVNKIPFFLKKNNSNLLILDFFKFLFTRKKVLLSEVLNWFYINVFIELNYWNYVNGIAVLFEMEYYYPLSLKNPPPKLLQKINIDAALCILKI